MAERLEHLIPGLFSLSAGDLVVVSDGNFFRHDTPKLGIVLEDAPKGFTFAKVHCQGNIDVLHARSIRRIEDWRDTCTKIEKKNEKIAN